MNLIEAVRSGKPFRRAGEEIWWKECTIMPGDYISTYGCREDGQSMFSSTVSNILAEDYEILDEDVTITRDMLVSALLEADIFYAATDINKVWEALQYSDHHRRIYAGR